MTVAPEAPPLVEPAFWSAPAYEESKLREVVEVCERCGLFLDAWQLFVLERALGIRSTGKWVAREVGVCVPRQNGKGGILEARELGGLFVFGERTLIHSAHQFDTSMKAFQRMEDLIEEGGLQAELRGRSGVSRSHGSEGFRLRDGRELSYRTRTKSGGRGFTGDLVIFDEAMILPESFLAAVLPVISARTIQGNPQIWYTGSAVDQFVHEYGVVFARARARGLKGDAKSLAWFEWSAALDPALSPADAFELLDDLAAWARANPALGIRISQEYIDETERPALDDRGFAVERLGVGDWPKVDTRGGTVIASDDWAALEDEASTLEDPFALAYDVSPMRTTAAIVAASKRERGGIHLEVVEHRKGTGWLVDRLVELAATHQPDMLLCDGPARSFTKQLEEKGLEVHEMTGTEYAQACGMLVDAVSDRTVWHLGPPELQSAIRGADTSPLGDAWKWSRRRSQADITPLVAATLAHWGATQLAGGEYVSDPSAFWA